MRISWTGAPELAITRSKSKSSFNFLKVNALAGIDRDRNRELLALSGKEEPEDKGNHIGKGNRNALDRDRNHS